jgi:ketosteroid isomerase-like protein
MSENLDLARAWFEIWNRADLEGWLGVQTPDAEFWTSGTFPDFDPVYRGSRRLAEWWHRLHEPWDPLRMDPERFEEVGDWVVCAFRFRAKGVGSGVEVDLQFAAAIRVVNGFVVRTVTRRTLEEARAVALGGHAELSA